MIVAKHQVSVWVNDCCKTLSEWMSDFCKMSSEWESDCCSTLSDQFFSYIKFRYYNDDMHFVIDQHAELDFWSASSLKRQSSYINFDKPAICMGKNSVRENLWNFCVNCLFVAEKMAVLYIIIIILLKFIKWIIFFKIKH